MKLIIYLTDNNLILYQIKANKILQSQDFLIEDSQLFDELIKYKKVFILVDSIDETINLDWAPRLNYFDRNIFAKHRTSKSAAVFNQKFSWLNNFKTGLNSHRLSLQQYKIISLNKFTSLANIIKFLEQQKIKFELELTSLLLKEYPLKITKIKQTSLVTFILNSNKLKQLLIDNKKLLFHRQASINSLDELSMEKSLALDFIAKNNLLEPNKLIKTLELEISQEQLILFFSKKLLNPFYKVFYQPKESYKQLFWLLILSFTLFLTWFYFQPINKKQFTENKPIAELQPDLVIEQIEDSKEEITAKTEIIKKPANKIKIQALAQIGEQQLIQINNKLLKKNDELNQVTVIEISQQTIKLGYKGQEKTVLIGEEYDLNRWPELANPAKRLSIKINN